MQEDESGARFAIETLDDNAFSGWCSMFRWNPVYRSLGIGYCFDEPAWGKGYATEAVALCCSGPIANLTSTALKLNLTPAMPHPLGSWRS